MYRESLLSFNIYHLQENKIEHRVQQNTDNLIKFHLAYSLHKIEYNTTYTTCSKATTYGAPSFVKTQHKGSSYHNQPTKGLLKQVRYPAI